ncbi:S8 family serine peptidase [Actinoplanes solisilvae]|uniref:S8 family serine peptidase n=1 Tax=Actinoplanes solisilvae TaxID=2486853 RepID=UPI000FDB638E|nr:S8 family serine peptidase [Actinoplanes solisilvae]
MRSEKLDLGATLAYQEYLDRRDDLGPPPAISVVLSYEGDLDAVRAAGFDLAWSNADQAVGTLRWADLDALTELPQVLRIATGLPRTPRLDTAGPEIRARASTVANIGVDGLWHVAKPSGALTVGGTGASGKGVIVGIIDTGIDVSHPAFCTAQVPYRSRILKVWDQGLTPVAANGEASPIAGRMLSGRRYGVEFDTATIETQLNASTYPALPFDFRHKDCIGHGTHVAAIAAGGNQVAGGSDASFVGAAPEADLIIVKMLDLPDVITDSAGNQVPADVRLLDAVIYILREAAAQVPPKPVVINASFGSAIQPGDGLSNEDRFLDETFDPARPADASHFPSGAIFVKSAGNDGDPARRGFAVVTIPDSGEIVVPFELFDDRGPNLSKRVNCTAKPFVPSGVAAIWYREVAAPGDVSFAARVPGEAAFSAPVFSGSLSKLFDGGKRRVMFHESLRADRPVPPPPATVPVTRNRMALVIEPKVMPAPLPPLHKPGVYELRFAGPPGTELYAMCSMQGSAFGRFGMRIATAYQNGDPLPAPEIVNGSATPITLIDVTSRHSMADGGSRNVISVAAYDDLDAKLAAFSSRGPLRDFSDPPLGPVAPKPDLGGPGVKINAALAQDSDKGIAAILSAGSVAGNRFTELRGTSMAAPMIAGTVALMLEKNPALTVDQVRAALSTAAAARAGADPVPADPGYADAYGAGRVAALESHTNTP